MRKLGGKRKLSKRLWEWEKRKKPNIEHLSTFQEIEVNSSDLSSDSDLLDEDPGVRRKAHLRRDGKKMWIKFRKFLRTKQSKPRRLCVRPGNDQNNQYMIPIDQVMENAVLSQASKQSLLVSI